MLLQEGALSVEDCLIIAANMRLYTEQECEDWLRERKRLKPDAFTGRAKGTL